VVVVVFVLIPLSMLALIGLCAATIYILVAPPR
jgi:hypothetical protein